jgi:hypothetical protein
MEKQPDGSTYQVALTPHELFTYLSTLYLHSLWIIQQYESYDEVVQKEDYSRFAALGEVLNSIIPETTDRLTLETMESDFKVPDFVEEQYSILIGIDRMATRLSKEGMPKRQAIRKIKTTYRRRVTKYLQQAPEILTQFQPIIPFNLLNF